MEFSLIIARLIAYITPWALPGSLIFLLIGTVIDIENKKFHWSKFALIFLVVTIVLFIIQIKLIYFVTGDVLNNPK